MCLIAIAWRAHPRYRLALIANRDEAHDRPASPAGFDPADATLYGGRDLRAGGSWLMASTRGRLAAVTNVRAGLAEGAMPRSRGALVHGFVAGSDSSPAFLAGLAGNAPEYGRFNLLAWDGTELGFASNHPAFERRPVSPGLHAMSNGAFDAPWPKSGHAVAALDAWLQSSLSRSDDDMAVAPLLDALADTSPAPDAALPDTGVGLELERRLSPPFVRGPNYGTRCSSVVLVGADSITFVEQSYGPDGVPRGRTRATFAIA
ncbi:NRDE family protein [Lysobacter sp. S4-A87]|uniref:NRDE family protein n=1 Tax=Lysobacter sp. S4-A87 TaxID=2925843 RepID=UPI001F531512|nr:NRDE family protein [Lysobacter sp. S4-A87]UNK50160.1 NRDE family protein [Lysobacter sp. S4-A87]